MNYNESNNSDLIDAIDIMGKIKAGTSGNLESYSSLNDCVNIFSAKTASSNVYSESSRRANNSSHKRCTEKPVPKFKAGGIVP